jgi:GAF domain-containing protein
LYAHGNRSGSGVEVSTSETIAELLASEGLRLAALRSYCILDTPPEGAFDDITRMAAMICQTPMALVSLIDSERQWFKSETGVGVSETPIGSAICAHAIRQTELLVVPDTTKDARFRDNPLVVGEPRLRFYAGAPLITREGLALGTVCVLDRRPRLLNQDQLYALKALARQTMVQLELRKALNRPENSAGD